MRVRIRLLASLFLAFALAWTPLARGQKAPAKQAASKSATSAKKKPAAKKTPRKRVARQPRQTEPDAHRSREIQEALVREGYLTSKPSGKWDAATSEAFARFQRDNGLPVTGKPESRALIKLGLGGPNHTQ
jgi:peptidoglycan hydrolase-like protein with peptidoglycan-binding domain